jgi:hypothetical protein
MSKYSLFLFPHYGFPYFFRALAKKTALLVFSALAYVSAKNQMCCLRVGVFSSNVQL